MAAKQESTRSRHSNPAVGGDVSHKTPYTHSIREVQVGVKYFVGVSAYVENWNESPIAGMTLTVPEDPAAVRGVSALWAMIRRWFG